MKNSALIVNSAIAGLLALGLSAGSALAAEKETKTEKCYGVAKAGKNDCQTATSSCAGTAKKDAEATAWIAVPKGTCDKIVGGSTKPKS